MRQLSPIYVRLVFLSMKNTPFFVRFLWTLWFCAVHYNRRVRVGSSSCRVTGVSSLNLARRPKGLAGFFLFD
jgi:hypothetical protein